MYAKISVKFEYFTIITFCYSTEEAYGTISFERPNKVIVVHVSNVPLVYSIGLIEKKKQTKNGHASLRLRVGIVTKVGHYYY